MTRTNKLSLIPLYLASFSLAVLTSVSYAEEEDAKAITQAKVSLIQAITAAEQQVKGKAIHAEFEKTKLGWIYAVEVASNDKEFDVVVDASSGKVVSTTEDTDDQESKDEKHEKHD